MTKKRFKSFLGTFLHYFFRKHDFSGNTLDLNATQEFYVELVSSIFYSSEEKKTCIVNLGHINMQQMH